MTSLRNAFLDEVEDEQMWNQINLLALASNTSAEVRKKALYFIMEQLEAFDDTDDRANNSYESKHEQQLDAIASWAAHQLIDGPIPIENINVQLVNYLVDSLRCMPEHSSIIKNWSAMLKVINDDIVARTSQGTSAGDRADIAKQRVLVQMLAYAAKSEVGSMTDSSLMKKGYK